MPTLVSDIAVFVLKRDVKLQLTHSHAYLTYLSRTSRTHRIHQSIPFLSPWASALGLLTAYALESRVGWAPARREQTNERSPFTVYNAPKTSTLEAGVGIVKPNSLNINLAYYRNYYIDSNKILHNDKYHQILFMGVSSVLIEIEDGGQ